MSLMYEDLAQLEIKLMQLIEQQQKDKVAKAAAAGAAGDAAPNKADVAARKPMVRAQAVTA